MRRWCRQACTSARRAFRCIRSTSLRSTCGVGSFGERGAERRKRVLPGTRNARPWSTQRRYPFRPGRAQDKARHAFHPRPMMIAHRATPQMAPIQKPFIGANRVSSGIQSGSQSAALSSERMRERTNLKQVSVKYGVIRPACTCGINREVRKRY